MHYTIPSNVTDAGHDTRNTEPPPDLTDLCMYAVDELRSAYDWRSRRDDLTMQRKLRCEALLRAQEYITEALAMLEAKA